MHCKTFHSLKLLFKFFCLEPMVAPDNNHRPKNIRTYKYMFYCWYIVHFLLWSLQASIIWIYQDLIFYTKDWLGKFSDQILYFVAFAAYFSFQFDALQSRKKYLEIFKEFEKLEIILQRNRFELELIYAKFYKKYELKFILYFCCYFLSVLSLFFTKFHEAQSRNYSLAFTYQATLNSLKQLHFIFYMDLVNFHFKLLNEQLVELTEFSGYNEKNLKNRNYNKFLFKKLQTCKSYYNRLFKISELMNDVMGRSMYFCTLLSYFWILSNVYWFIFRSLNSKFQFFFGMSLIKLITR